MNILLVNPHSIFRNKALNEVTIPDMPLNLAYIAAVLEEDGHFVRILDLNTIRTKSELVHFITTREFHLLGFTGTTSVILNCYHAIRVLKKKIPRAIIVLGGWHASAEPERTLRECPEIDFIVRGEGEETIKELVQRLESNKGYADVQGIVYRENQRIVVTPERPLIQNLDRIPFPARHLMPLDAYKKKGFNTLGGYFKNDAYISGILTSRGCTGKCKFCADSVVNKYTCRFRTPENVIEEIKHAIRNYKIRLFFFMDPHFTNSPVRAKRICELIIKENLKILWACSARVDTVSEELLGLMKKAGCMRIGYGIESGSPKVLKIMNKRVHISQIKDAIRWTNKAGIKSVVYLLYAMPGEEPRDIQLTRQLITQIQPDFVNQTIAIPYPGTELRKFALEHNLIKDDRWEKYNYPFGNVLEYEGIERIYKFQAKNLIDYYLSPRYLFRIIKGLTSIYQVNFYIKALRVLVLGFFILNIGKEEKIRKMLVDLSTREKTT